MNKHEFIKEKDLFLHFLEHNKHVSIHTIKSYKLDIDQLIAFWNEGCTDSDCFETVATLFFEALHNRPDTRKSSYARKVSCFNTLKKFLKNKGYTIDTTFQRPVIHHKAPDIIDLESLMSLLEKMHRIDIPSQHPLRDKAIIELLYSTGMRCSELAHIEMNHINFEERSITIKPPYKKDRIVFFGRQAHIHIQKYIDYERPPIKNMHEKLFLNYRNTPLTIRSIQRICSMFKKCLETSFDLTPRTLRHACAQHMALKGADVEFLQQFLGHKTRMSTAKYIKDTSKHE
jgi:site-specific recombinase XerD